nr:hypothetical protein [Leptospira alstonii]
MKPNFRERTRTKKAGGSATRIIHSVFCIFLLSQSISAESYSEYRLDDLLIWEYGKKDLTGKGRFPDSAENRASVSKEKEREFSRDRISKDQTANNKIGKRSEEEIETEKKGTSQTENKTNPFYGNVTALYRGLTQKGGVWGEKPDRSFSRGILSPEVGWRNKGERVYHKILISPFLQYEENVVGTKTTTRGADAELLWITGWESPVFRMGIEAGRGYQRLDRNGFLFVGFLNYGEFQFHWKPLGITASVVGAQMQNSPLYTERDRNESPQRIVGGSVQMLENPFLQNFRIFYYLYKESRQEAVKGDFSVKAEPFRPYGAYQYYGFEFSSAKFYGLKIDLDGIQVLGSREYGLDSFRSYGTTQSTKGSLLGSRLVWERPEASYFLGGFYTSKDEELRIDRNSNGYAGIRTDPRGYGGKTSFLLMESLLIQEGNLFQEDGVAAKPNFENKGIRLVQFGVKKTWDRKWNVQGTVFNSSSSTGRGWEGNLTAGHQSEHSYILMSLSYAYVDPQKEKKIFFEEWEQEEPIRKYSRIYLSAGVYF